jgi:hypothetical protein
MGYKKCYYKLFNTATDTIAELQRVMRSLQAAQLETEDILTADNGPIQTEEESHIAPLSSS